jgi:hypothetical protein
MLDKISTVMAPYLGIPHFWLFRLAVSLADVTYAGALVWKI